MASGNSSREERRLARWLCAPLNTVPPGVGWLVTGATTLAVCAGTALVLRGAEPLFSVPDTDEYLHMARGQMALVHQPFASRPLEPMLVRGIAALTGADVKTGFVWVACLSFLVALLTVVRLAMRTETPRWFLLVTAALPFWPQLMHGVALPDVWYAGLLSCLLLLLGGDRPHLAALMLFPLMLSRESTSLILVCLLATAWRRLGWKGCALAVLAAAAGSVVVRHLGAEAGGNPEHLPETLYLIFKAPWNFVRTLGIQPWSNLYPSLCTTPAWQHSLHIGPLRSVGVCTTSRTAPREAATALLTTFGVLPVLGLVLWGRRRGRWGEDVLLRFCVLYGGVSFLIVPLLGTWYARFCGYAWPLFLVALPRLYGARSERAEGGRTGGGAVWVIVMFLAVQLALAKLAFFFREPGPVVYGVPVFALGTALLLSPWGRILRVSRTAGDGSGVLKLR